MKALMTAIAVCALLAFAGCGDSSSDEGTDTETAAPTTPTTSASGSEAVKRNKPKVVVPEGEPPAELVARDLIEGTGPEAKAGKEISVRYVGVGYDTGKEFDASWTRSRGPFTFKLGTNIVIPGWEQGFEGMKVGGQRELTIPPELAYGSTGSPPAIGPNETLIFVVDLLKVQ